MQTLLTLVLEYKEEKFKENNPNKSRTFMESCLRPSITRVNEKSLYHLCPRILKYCML